MYDLKLSNRFYRVLAVTTDQYGIDPLLDKITPKILKVPTYSNHEVTQDERGSPDLISFREYESEDYWWHIMTYNGICRICDIVEGQTLKIPDYGSLVAITNDTVSDLSYQSERIVRF
jgi:hypothetical protein